MKPLLSIVLMVVVYFVSAITFNQYSVWLSKSVPPMLSVLTAWFVYRQVSFIAIGSVLVLTSILLPLSVLLFGLDLSNSALGTLKNLSSGLSLSDFVPILAPLVIGLLTMATLRFLQSSRTTTPT